MGRLAGFASRDVIRVAEDHGWVHTRTRGDHLIFQKSGTPLHLSIPARRDLAESILHGLVKAMDLSVDEFLQLARK